MQKNITNVLCALDDVRTISDMLGEIKNNGYDLNKETFPLINPLSDIRKSISFLEEDDIKIYNNIKRGTENITHLLNDLNKEKINIIHEEIKKIELILFNLLKL